MANSVRGTALLMSSPRFKNCSYGSKKNIEIEPETGAFDIGNIQAQAIVEFQLGTPHDLPETGQSGHHIQPGGMPEFISLRSKRRRTRTDKTHLAFQNIEELGDLVQAGLSQKPSNTGNTRIVCDLKIGPLQLIHIGVPG